MRLRTPLTAILAAVLLAPAALAYPRAPQPYFSPNGGGADATAELIDEARDTVDIAMYSISTSGVIWDALERAVDRGVRVRIILHNATRSSGRAKANALAGIGVHVFGVTPTMHEKFALIDAERSYYRRLVNGSANWSWGAEHKYSENTVVYGHHYHLVYAFQQEFNRLLASARAISDGAADHQQPVVLNAPSRFVRRYEEAYFTSQNDGDSTYIVADKIIDLIRSAQTSIKIDVAHFNSERIAQALIDFHNDNPDVAIEILLDQGEYGDSRSRARDLEDAGLDVRYKTYSLAFHHPRSQLMHHKTITIDESTIGTGSYNWSDTAEHSNYENFLIIRDTIRRNQDLVEAFVAEHDQLYDLGRDVYPDFLDVMTADPDDDNYRRILPVHFDTPYWDQPMTLTRAETEPLRRAISRAGIWSNNRYHKEASYVDREAREPFSGDLPDERFMDAPADTPGLVGGLDNDD